MNRLSIFLVDLAFAVGAWASSPYDDVSRHAPAIVVAQIVPVVSFPRIPENQVTMVSSQNIGSFHLPPTVAEIAHKRPLLDAIADATGNPHGFMRHHAPAMSALPVKVLREGLTKGWYVGALQQGPCYTPQSQIYYDPEYYASGTFMNLRWQGLVFIPPNLLTLTQLTGLDLQSNHLSVLGVAIWNLTNLQALGLHFNHLLSLPREIGNLTGLRDLNLCCNNLQSVPREIGNFINLRELRLCDNQLRSLPREIENCTQLVKLYLQGNPFINLPHTCVNLVNLEELYLSQEQWDDPGTKPMLRALCAAQLALGKKTVIVSKWVGCRVAKVM